MSSFRSPTSQELLFSFSAESQELVGGAIERLMQEGVRPDLEGKKVSDLEVNFSKRAVHPSNPNIMEYRSVAISPVDRALVDDIRINASSSLDETIVNELDHYEAVSKKLASLVIGNGISKESFPNGVWAVSEYQAMVPDAFHPKLFGFNANFMRHTKKETVQDGRDLVDEFMNYLCTDELFFGRILVDSPTEIGHRIAFKMTPDLSINGTEDAVFLQNYRDSIESRLEEVTTKLIKCQMAGTTGGNEAIDTYMHEAAQLQGALDRVHEFIPVRLAS